MAHSANGMKSGRVLAAGCFLPGTLLCRFPRRAFPSGGFSLGFGARPVAFVALPWLALGFGTAPPVSCQGPAYVVRFLELAAAIAANVPFISASIDQLAFRHWLTCRRRCNCGGFPRSSKCCDPNGLRSQSGVALFHDFAWLLRIAGRSVPCLVNLLHPVGHRCEDLSIMLAPGKGHRQTAANEARLLALGYSPPLACYPQG
jgi:hypothetical protein